MTVVNEREATILTGLEVFLQPGQVCNLRAIYPDRNDEKAINVLYRDPLLLARRALHPVGDRACKDGLGLGRLLAHSTAGWQIRAVPVATNRRTEPITWPA